MTKRSTSAGILADRHKPLIGALAGAAAMAIFLTVYTAARSQTFDETDMLITVLTFVAIWLWLRPREVSRH